VAFTSAGVDNHAISCVSRHHHEMVCLEARKTVIDEDDDRHALIDMLPQVADTARILACREALSAAVDLQIDTEDPLCCGAVYLGGNLFRR